MGCGVAVGHRGATNKAPAGRYAVGTDPPQLSVHKQELASTSDSTGLGPRPGRQPAPAPALKAAAAGRCVRGAVAAAPRAAAAQVTWKTPQKALLSDGRGPLVCVLAEPTHEAIGRDLAEELAQQLQPSPAPVPVAATPVAAAAAAVAREPSALAALALLSGHETSDGRAAVAGAAEAAVVPTCEVLVPLLTPEWLRAPGGAAVLRGVLRLRALSLGPELLPLVHVTAFGARGPDAIARALSMPVGTVLREAAAPGSWGRMDTGGSGDGGDGGGGSRGVTAAVSWLVARVEAAVATGVVGPSPAAAAQGGGAGGGGRGGEGGRTPMSRCPMVSWRRQPPPSVPTVSEPKSPQRPPGMPSLRGVGCSKMPAAASNSNIGSKEGGESLEGDLELPVTTKVDGELGERVERRRPSLRSSAEVTSVASALSAGQARLSSPEGHPASVESSPLRSTCGQSSTGGLRNSTAEWEDALRSVLGEPEPTLGPLFIDRLSPRAAMPIAGGNPVLEGDRAANGIFAPVPTCAIPEARSLPPQPRSPSAGGGLVSPNGHCRRQRPWWPNDMLDRDQRPVARGRIAGPVSEGTSSSAPPTPRGREDGWDHFSLCAHTAVPRAVVDPSRTTTDGLGPPTAVLQLPMQSLPASPRDTLCSWSQSTLPHFQFDRTRWGCTSMWIGQHLAEPSSTGWGWKVPGGLEEETVMSRGGSRSNSKSEAGDEKPLGPLVPQGMPPLPVSPAGCCATAMASTAANPFGAGIWPSAPSASHVEVEGHFGRYSLGVPLPAAGLAGGTWGPRFAAVDNSLNRRVVVWRFEVPAGIHADSVMGLDGEHHALIRDRVGAEVENLRHIRHPRLCPYLACEIIHGELYIIVGYAPGGSVADWLREVGLLGLAPTRRIAHAAIDGLAYLHGELGLVHGALCAANVLLGPGTAVRLADFGLGAVCGVHIAERAGRCAGIAFALPPEIVSGAGGPTTSAGDIWSLGCLMAEMLTGSPTEGLDLKGIDPAAYVVVAHCLQALPAARPSAPELLVDKWLAAS